MELPPNADWKAQIAALTTHLNGQQITVTTLDPELGVGCFHSVTATPELLANHIEWVMCGTNNETTFVLMPASAAKRTSKHMSDIVKEAIEDGCDCIFYPNMR